MTNFSQMDGLTAELWLRLAVQAWPLKIVSTAEFEEMTAHLRCYDDDERIQAKEKQKTLKNTCNEISSVPSWITVVPFVSSFSVACDLCEPRRKKSINWHPDKRPAADRCADYLIGHLRSTHKIHITTESAVDFVDPLHNKQGHDQIARNRDTLMTLENTLRGSGDLGAMCDAVYALKVTDKQTLQVQVENVKARDFEPVPLFLYKADRSSTTSKDFGLLASIEEPVFKKKKKREKR